MLQSALLERILIGAREVFLTSPEMTGLNQGRAKNTEDKIHNRPDHDRNDRDDWGIRGACRGILGPPER